MPSNEAIELIESVLTSVNESDRWQYRYADLQKKKLEELDKEIEKEKEKVELYGKDSSKLKDLIRKKQNIPYVDNKKLKEYRTGTDNGRKLDPNDEWMFDDDRTIHNRKADMSTYGTDMQNPFVPEMRFTANLPKNKGMHERINKRTAKKDTTARHEAACILIEALDTLLSE